jgi:undecaprenyl-diphosphatase
VRSRSLDVTGISFVSPPNCAAPLALAAVAGLSLVIVLLINGDSHVLDWAVLRLLHPGADQSDPLGPAWFDRAVADFTSLGSVSVLAALSLGAAGLLFLQRRPTAAILPALAFGGGLTLSEALKSLFSRERPPEAWRAVEVLNPSFPSGHALLSAAVYLTLGAMLSRAAPDPAVRRFIMAAGILLAVLVGLSRIHLGVHWTSDVLAGWCIGAALAAVCLPAR